MHNDFSSGFRDSAPSADSGLKFRMPYEQSEQVSSVVDKKRRIGEPELIGEILPGVMADIKKRKKQQSFRAFIVCKFPAIQIRQIVGEIKKYLNCLLFIWYIIKDLYS